MKRLFGEYNNRQYKINDISGMNSFTFENQTCVGYKFWASDTDLLLNAREAPYTTLYVAETKLSNFTGEYKGEM